MQQQAYLEYFKLAEAPYKMTPDPRFLYMTPQHEEALGKCQMVINQRGGLVAIYGKIGMGKTTVARRLFEVVRDTQDCQVAMLVTPALKTDNAFLKAIMDEFGVAPKRSYYASLIAFQSFLINSYKQGKNTVVIVDEAQKLTPRLLDVLHTLLNFESNTEKFLQIVLIGQEELAENIDKVLAIKSRVRVFGSLLSLTLDDCKEMVAFRWAIASARKSSDPFSDEALVAIYELSGGLPREIMKLCDEGLLRAFFEKSPTVTVDMINEAGKELRLAPSEAA